MLNPADDVDIYCLSICFSTLLQKDLDLFRETWNLHKVRTAHYQTPYQMFETGLHNLRMYEQQTGRSVTELNQVRRLSEFDQLVKFIAMKSVLTV